MKKAIDKSAPDFPALAVTKIEILETINAGGFSEELRTHWKTVVLPLLKGLLPGGKNVTLAFLSDPPVLEIRRPVS